MYFKCYQTSFEHNFNINENILYETEINNWIQYLYLVINLQLSYSYISSTHLVTLSYILHIMHIIRHKKGLLNLYVIYFYVYQMNHQEHIHHHKYGFTFDEILD